ncbi:hypothetical protein Emed_003914 [Eimeria media]
MEDPTYMSVSYPLRMHEWQRAAELPLDASASSLESYAPVDYKFRFDGFTIEDNGGEAHNECCKVPRKVRSKLFNSLVLLCFAVDLLLFFVCPELPKNVFGGVQGRRLSEDNGKDEDDLSPPSTPELLELCFEIENELSSEEILPEAPRASPVMVQEFLDELEGSEASPPGIWPEDALQANVESGKAAEKVGIPSSSVTSASFESEESVYNAGLLDAHGSASFQFHSISLGNQLSPGDAYTETSRESPVMVQEFFEDLEGEAETGTVVGPADPLDAPHLQSLKLPTLGLSVKRPAPDDGEDDGEVAGPSSKVAKTDTIPSPPCSVSSSETKESSPSSAAGSTKSGGFVSSVASSSLDPDEFPNFLDSMISESEPSDAPPVPHSVSTDASPSSAVVGPGPSSAPSGDDTTVHPWLRVPDFTPGVGEMEFRPDSLGSSLAYYIHGPLMVKIRELLIQAKLDCRSANRLVVYSEFLANHAYQRMRGPVSSRRPTDAAEALGRRFMIFFLLHSASKALRQPWPQQQWWRDLASGIPSKCPFTPGGKGLNSASKASVALAEQLSAAIELYKSGSAPDDNEIVEIMRKLFCSPVSPHHFKAELWDPWRRDDDPSSSST